MTELYSFFFVYRDNLTIDYYIYITISLISCGTNVVPDHIPGAKFGEKERFGTYPLRIYMWAMQMVGLRKRGVL